jgi:hypothetical protein
MVSARWGIAREANIRSDAAARQIDFHGTDKMRCLALRPIGGREKQNQHCVEEFSISPPSWKGPSFVAVAEPDLQGPSPRQRASPVRGDLICLFAPQPTGAWWLSQRAARVGGPFHTRCTIMNQVWLAPRDLAAKRKCLQPRPFPRRAMPRSHSVRHLPEGRRGRPPPCVGVS